LESPHFEEQYLAVATEVVNRFLQAGFWQFGRRVAFLLDCLLVVALVISCSSCQDCWIGVLFVVSFAARARAER
jgi:hypothetical protein